MAYNNNQQERDWGTKLFDCTEDQESCWWTTWCPCVISARTIESFELGSSQKIMYVAVAVFGVAYLLARFHHPGLALLVLVIYGLYTLYERANARNQIRHKANILTTTQSLLNDYWLHCACFSCAICQESRESAAVTGNNLDYCSGQKLEELVPQSSAMQMSNGIADTPDDIEDQILLSEANEALSSTSWSSFASYRLWLLFYQHQLSRTSQFLLQCIGVFAIYMLIHIMIINPLNLVLLICIFLQPTIIIYTLLYWRKWRKYAQMDYIIKLFLVGFFMATTQSVVFESILQALIGFMMITIFEILNPGYDWNQNTDDPTSNTPPDSSASANAVSTIGGKWIIESIQYYNAQQGLVFPNLVHFFYPTSTITGTTTEEMMSNSFDPMSLTAAHHDNTGLNKLILQQNLILLLVLFFLLAFVVAAGVEETMKHFVVKCCKFPYNLKNPYILTIYFLAGALGFATAENIEYVLQQSTHRLHGTAVTTVFLSELFIFFLRILMPIHLICAVLQAVQVTKVTLNMCQMNIVQILLPAIILHGSFDFVLFTLGAIQFVYDIQSPVYDALSFILPLAITFGGAYYAYKQFTQLHEFYHNNYHPLTMHDESIHNVVHPL